MLKPTFLIFAILLGTYCFSQSKNESLIVYGDGFSFSVKEPTGWMGDIANANKYKANIIFYKNKAELKNVGTIVQVLTFKKEDEHTEDDLREDLNAYKKDYPTVKFQDFSVTHSSYRCFSKIAYVDQKFFQYIVYLNPG